MYERSYVQFLSGTQIFSLSRAPEIIGSFSIDNGDGSENVSVFQTLSRLFQFAENA